MRISLIYFAIAEKSFGASFESSAARMHFKNGYLERVDDSTFSLVVRMSRRVECTYTMLNMPEGLELSALDAEEAAAETISCPAVSEDLNSLHSQVVCHNTRTGERIGQYQDSRGAAVSPCKDLEEYRNDFIELLTPSSRDQGKRMVLVNGGYVMQEDKTTLRVVVVNDDGDASCMFRLTGLSDLDLDDYDMRSKLDDFSAKCAGEVAPKKYKPSKASSLMAISGLVSFNCFNRRGSGFMDEYWRSTKKNYPQNMAHSACGAIRDLRSELKTLLGITDSRIKRAFRKLQDRVTDTLRSLIGL